MTPHDEFTDTSNGCEQPAKFKEVGRFHEPYQRRDPAALAFVPRTATAFRFTIS
jgi:hypothetical protein